MREFKIGDSVLVRQFDDLERRFGLNIDGDINTEQGCFTREMEELCGNIINVTEENLFYGDIEVWIDGEDYYVTTDMVTFLNDCEFELPLHFHDGLLDHSCIMSNDLKPKVEELKLRSNQLIFAKTKPNAIIPTKREEDAGFDIYSCETETIVIPPNTTRMIETGIAIACSKEYFPKFFDKGGMGSKGVVIGAGVGDSGYRDGYFVPLINTNGDKYVVITNQSQEEIDSTTHFDLVINMFIELSYKYMSNTNSFFESNKRFVLKSDCIIKPLNKAITQFVMLPVPKMEISEVSWEELKNIKSERGLGKLGSSLK